MKKTLSLSLEMKLVEDTIDKVKKEEHLSSRSAALERILLYYQFSNDNIKQTLPTTEARIDALSTAKPESEYIDKNIDSTFENMKD